MRFLFLGVMLAILVSACKDDASTVSLNLKDKNELDGATLVDTFQLTGGTYLYDSTLTSDYGTLWVGNNHFTETGNIVTKGFAALRKSSDTATAFSLVPNTAVVDSLVIKVVSRRLHFKLNSPTLRVDLHQMLTPLSSDSIYFANNRHSYISDVLAFDNSKDQAKDTLKFIVTPTTGASVLNELYAISADSHQIKHISNYEIDQRIKGFAFVAPNPDGPLNSIDLASATSAVTLYYHGDSAYTSGTSTLTKQGAKYKRVFTFGGGHYYHAITADRSAGNPDIVQLGDGKFLDAKTIASQNIYIQNGGALWGKLNFPGLTTFLNNPAYAKATIVKAEISLPASPTPEVYPSPTTIINPSKYFFGFPQSANHLDIGRFGNLSAAFYNGASQSSQLANSSFQYDSATQRLSVDITRYVNAIQAGTQANTGAIIAIPGKAESLQPYAFTIDPANERRARLKVFYTVLK